VILDRIVGSEENQQTLGTQKHAPKIVLLPSRQVPRDFSPLIANSRMSIGDDAVFFGAPTLFSDAWVQVVVPALAALLPNTTLEVRGDQRPPIGAVLHNEFDNHFIFLQNRKSKNYGTTISVRRDG
jgi:hypothetical protein